MLDSTLFSAARNNNGKGTGEDSGDGKGGSEIVEGDDGMKSLENELEEAAADFVAVMNGDDAKSDPEYVRGKGVPGSCFRGPGVCHLSLSVFLYASHTWCSWIAGVLNAGERASISPLGAHAPYCKNTIRILAQPPMHLLPVGAHNYRSAKPHH